MTQEVLYCKSASALNDMIAEYIEQGYRPIGSHKVVEKHHQLRYAGMQHKDTTIELEYSQTMRKD